MPKRVCYIHVGPHKTGTTSIQWFLQENREELLKCGYFVPESETKRGAHYAVVEKLCGLELGSTESRCWLSPSGHSLRRPLKQSLFLRSLWKESCEAENMPMYSSAESEN